MSADQLEVGSLKEWDSWLRKYHDSVTEVHLLFYNKGAGINAITRDEADDTAMCHGWTMAGGRSLGDGKRAVRYAPRKPTSSLSDRNRGRARRLLAAGALTPAGRARLPEDL